MRKAAARKWFEITGVKAERLQDITAADAIAEGIQFYDEFGHRYYKDYLADASGYGHPDYDFPTAKNAVDSFRTLWISINGAESWAANPWVWAISFKKFNINTNA
jgi:ADP-ribose pyrophosphatase YjhB (NUDIX family)